MLVYIHNNSLLWPMKQLFLDSNLHISLHIYFHRLRMLSFAIITLLLHIYYSTNWLWSVFDQTTDSRWELIDSHGAGAFVCPLPVGNWHRNLLGGQCVSSGWPGLVRILIRIARLYITDIQMSNWLGMWFVYRCLTDGEWMAYARLPFPATGYPVVGNIYLYEMINIWDTVSAFTRPARMFLSTDTLPWTSFISCLHIKLRIIISRSVPGLATDARCGWTFAFCMMAHFRFIF